MRIHLQVDDKSAKCKHLCFFPERGHFVQRKKARGLGWIQPTTVRTHCEGQALDK